LDGDGKQGIDTAFSRIYEYVAAKLIEKVNEVETEITNTKG